jgi:hypothetical protein
MAHRLRNPRQNPVVLRRGFERAGQTHLRPRISSIFFGSSISRCSASTANKTAGIPVIIRSPRPSQEDVPLLKPTRKKSAASITTSSSMGSNSAAARSVFTSPMCRKHFRGTARHSARGNQAALRLHARCFQIRRAAPWRHCPRFRSADSHSLRHSEHPRRHCLPKNREGYGSDDGFAIHRFAASRG